MRTLKVGILFLVGCASVEEKMRNLSVEYSISPQLNPDTVRTIAVFAKNDIYF
jgi:predicted component of type VI protein secretion system